MKAVVMKRTPQEIAELFESDDELPDSYVESPEIPAYQNDNRFPKSKPYKESLCKKLNKGSQQKTNKESQLTSNEVNQLKPKQVNQLKPKQVSQQKSNEVSQLKPKQVSQLKSNEVCQLKSNKVSQLKPNEVSQLTETRSKPWYAESVDDIATEYKKTSETHVSDNISPEQEMFKPKKIQISNGMLTKRDIFLVKSIEDFTSASTLLWFIDFLNYYKAVTPWQRSCLVVDITHDAKYMEMKQPFPDFNMRYYLKFAIN